MELTIEEQDILAGGQGDAKKKAMKLLVGLGEFYNANRLIPVASTQISGVSYKTGGEALISVLEEFCSQGVKVYVPSYLNPAGMDRQKWEDMGVNEHFAEKQNRIIKLYTTLGITDICSCTPYNVVEPPKEGQHVAWAESSAVAYCNSVLGARTNREGSLSALAAAIIGKTPEYGLHLDSARVPDVRVFIDAELEDGDIPIIGMHVGEILQNEIPYFTGLTNVQKKDLKALGAAMAATGSVALFHVQGMTPEASEFEDMSLPQIVVDGETLQRWWDNAHSPSQEAELIFFGCPHCDREELAEIAGYLDGRKIAEGKRLWVFTPRTILDDPTIQKHLQTITDAGGEVYADTCCVVAPLEELGLSGVVTDSGKASVYLKNLCSTMPKLMSKRSCVEFALTP